MEDAIQFASVHRAGRMRLRQLQLGRLNTN